MNNAKILGIFGTKDSGKSSIAKRLVDKYGYHPVLNYTSRAKRPNEINGIDGIYLSEEEMINMIQRDEFIEYKYHLNAYYGLHKREFHEAINNHEKVVFHFTGDTIFRFSKLYSVIPILIRRDDLEILNWPAVYKTKDKEKIGRYFHSLEQLGYSPFCNNKIKNTTIEIKNKNMIESEIDKLIEEDLYDFI